MASTHDDAKVSLPPPAPASFSDGSTTADVLEERQREGGDSEKLGAHHDGDDHLAKEKGDHLAGEKGNHLAGEKGDHLAGEKGASSDDDLAKSKDLAVATEAVDDGDVERAEPEFVRTITGVRWLLVIIAILSSTFLFALDNTIVSVIQPAIVTRFDSVDKLTWLSVGFLIGTASTVLLFGRIYSQFNIKWTYILTVLLFEVGSAVCGAAPSMNAMIVGRVVAGIGGGGMYTGVMTLLAATTSIHERPMYVALTGLTWAIGTITGPLIGGAFDRSSVGWRFAFYINLFVGAAFAPIYLFMLPNVDPQPGKSVRARLAEMDYLGAVLIVGAFVSGVMAISFGGVTYAWNSGTIIGLFVCSGVLFILFAVQQAYCLLTTPARRIFPCEFMRSRSLLILFACTAAGGAIIFICVYMIPLFFQFTRADDALEAGVRLLPYIALMVVFVIANGALMSKWGWYYPWFASGGVLVIIGAALMYTVRPGSSTSRVYGYTILIGAGVGCFAQAGFSVAQGVVTRQGRNLAAAIGFITCGQVTGVTIALAIANSIFLNDSQERIEKLLPAASPKQIEQAIAGVAGHFFAQLTAVEQQGVIKILVDAIDKAYILVITGGAVVVVLSYFMKREKLFLEAGGAA